MSSTAEGTMIQAAQSAAAIRREKFIPISQAALLDRLAATEAADPTTRLLGSSIEFFRYLAVWRHQTYQRRLAKLKQCYLPFSPDTDTKRVTQYSAPQLDALESELIQNVRVLLQQANYTEIDQQELDRMLRATSPHGLVLTVNLKEFDRVLLFSRGNDIEVFERREPDNLYLFKRRYEVPLFARLFLLLKLKSIDSRVKEIMREQRVSEKIARRIAIKQRRGLPDDPNGSFVYLRLFKSIPKEDLEMMFPNTQVRLRMFDKVKLGVTAGGGTVAGIAGAASKVMAAVATANPIGLAAALFGVAGVVSRQVMTVFNTRTRYMMMLAQRLFFHSLANNRGVLTLLIDRAEEEDIKEEMLAYYFLLRHPMPNTELCEDGQLDRLIEQFLTREFAVSVDFDLEDALSRLKADGLVLEGSNGFLEALPPRQACRRLQRKWQRLLSGGDPGAGEKTETNAVYEAEV